jgi:hypothetical protein
MQTAEHKLLFLILLLVSTLARGALTVPMEVKMPGTQPEDNVNLDLNSACDQCHEDSDDEVSILSDWRGSMMSQPGAIRCTGLPWRLQSRISTAPVTCVSAATP